MKIGPIVRTEIIEMISRHRSRINGTGYQMFGYDAEGYRKTLGGALTYNQAVKRTNKKVAKHNAKR